MKICPACSREYGLEHDICVDDGAQLVKLDTGTASRAQDLIGEVIDGRYKIDRIVGRGGMGTVYSCKHVVVGKSFAMKVLRAGIERSEEVLQRFIREAQAANSVRSRHICEMTDFGQLPNGSFYVVMELLDGSSLTRALREKRLKYSDINRVFVQIAETLQKAHQVGIIHRDLKPDNVVLVQDEDDPFFVKLVDFGIAKVMESRASNLTETGVILGTPYYMSPEQARGDQIDHRSDIYALGVMMYRAFTGKLPFVADTAMGVLTRHLTEQPELPSRVAEVEPALERLIMRCLEKKPIARFQTMGDVADALRSLGGARPVMHSHPTLDERAAPLPASGVERPASHGRHDTPTRVETPDAKSSRAIPAPTAVPEVMRQAAAATTPPASVPPPLPNQEPAVGSGSYPHQLGPTGPQDPGRSGPHAAAPYMMGPPGLIDPLQGEAATNRGVVSSRLRSVHPTANRRVGLWIAAAAVMTLVGASAAYVVFGGAGATRSDGVPATGSDGGKPEAEQPEKDAMPSAQLSAPAPTSSVIEIPEPPASAPRVDGSAVSPFSGKTPPPATRPPPEIRSPFDP